MDKKIGAAMGQTPGGGGKVGVLQRARGGLASGNGGSIKGNSRARRPCGSTSKAEATQT